MSSTTEAPKIVDPSFVFTTFSSFNTSTEILTEVAARIIPKKIASFPETWNALPVNQPKTTGKMIPSKATNIPGRKYFSKEINHFPDQLKTLIRSHQSPKSHGLEYQV